MSISVAGAPGASTGLVERAAHSFARSVPEHPRDDGFFGPRSVTWRVNRHPSVPAAAVRALLLQALHPLAMAGVDQHSYWREDPASRLASTSAYVATISFGDRAAAERAAARVRRIHERVQGTDPATRKAYTASDPALLLWVHNALVDSQLTCIRLYGTISARDEDRYVGEMTAAARLIGIPDGLAPATAGELVAYFDAVRPDLRCTPAAAAATGHLLELLADDPGAAGIWGIVMDAAIASLPDWASALYGQALPAAGETPERSEVRQALGVLDAVFMGEPGVLEARQRLQLRTRAASFRAS